MQKTDSSWLKDNLFVIAALVLPLVVIGFFLIATGIPRLLVDDPQYDMLYFVEQYEDQEFAFRYRVVDRRLVTDVRLNAAPGFSPNQILFRFDAKTQTAIRVQPAVPDGTRERLQELVAAAGKSDWAAMAPQPAAAGPTVTFEVTETATMALLPGPLAPDGYEFRNDFAGGRGLFGEIFGMGSRRSGFSVARNGRVIPLQMPTDNRNRYYNDARLLGWIAQ